MTALSFDVTGMPAPQGSKSAFRNPHTGRINQVESSKKVAPWRQDVRAAAIEAREKQGHETFTGPVAVVIAFRFPRTKGHYGTGKNAAALKPSAPAFPHTRATYDLDKLQRSTFDAMVQAGVIGDDSQISYVAAAKCYCEGTELPGANVTVLDPLDSDAS